jgi:hypothetical protein
MVLAAWVAADFTRFMMKHSVPHEPINRGPPEDYLPRCFSIFS